MVFITLLIGYTTWDWYGHVSRPDSTFAAHPVAWGAFSAASIGVVIAVVVIGHALVHHRRGRAGCPVHVLLVAAGFVLHVLVSGPALNALLWPHGRLIFKPVAAIVVSGIAVAVLGVLRLILRPGPRPT